MNIAVVFHESDAAVITDFRKCYCKTVGQDDGEQTCFKHHDCALENCSHAEVDIEAIEYVS